MYSGPFLAILDLSKPTYQVTVNSLISQTLDSEMDQGQNCRKYPYEHYENYRECDEEYVLNEVMKHNFMPFQATSNLSSVTKLRWERLFLLRKKL